ncbi:MAG TPA: S46 family peptidase [Rhizomicrobium sp.]|nr:S46 family peptidase [Rhizomicrobium sp.]
MDWAKLAGLGAAAMMLNLAAARADEGMWTFDNFPSAAVKAKYGVTIDQAWLDRVQAASVRLSSGCSASVVTASGLVLTNHHCVRECAQNLSTAATNYVQDGFSAVKREDEKLCPGMQAEILEGISDVTTAINAATAGKSGGDFMKTRDAAIAATEKKGCAGQEARYRCQVVTLYQGGQYKLYRYRKYSDVRLVFAPEAQTAFFGGDPDNFNFPRYDLDFSFVRLYEGEKPAATPAHLTWSAAPPKDGEPIFVSGNPGSTQRLLTAEQLMFLRDLQLPETLILYSELRGRLIRFASESAEHERISEDLLFGIENSFKAYHGEEQALVDPALIAAKAQYDRDLKASVQKNAALAQGIGDPWAEIAAVQGTRKALYRPYYFMEARAGIGSDLFRYARALVRAAEERAKPDKERLPEYSDSKLPLLEKTVLDPQPVYPELEQLALEFWLSKLRENLTADAQGTKVFLGKDSPETLAARLAKSELGDPALRKKLWEGGKAAVEASTDPLIRFVLATDAASRSIRKQYEDRVLGPTDRAAERIAKARFAIHGTSDYPDATFSARLTYGAVKGWTDNGVTVGPFTRFSGLWQRATGQFPFNLAPRWQAAKGKVDDNTIFDFVTDNDIIGGNSGSPAITADGKVVGAIFDGNIESLGGAFGFDGHVNRAVAVSTAAVTEALKKVYGNERLAAELTGG